MEESERVLKIAGSGSTSGGEFKEVKISGSGRIDGDLECEEFKSSGSSVVKGSVQAERIKINGSSRIDGDLRGGEADLRGHTSVRGAVQVKKLNVSGAGEVDGNVAAEELHVNGSITIQGDCEAEVFQIRGGFQIGGLLNAGVIDIKLYGGSHAKEIGGEKIRVRRERLNYLDRLFKNLFQKKITTDLIEGDEIELVETHAKVVRGTNVTIGKGCEIELVEYKNEFNLEKGAKVGRNQKI